MPHPTFKKNAIVIFAFARDILTRSNFWLPFPRYNISRRLQTIQVSDIGLCGRVPQLEVGENYSHLTKWEVEYLEILLIDVTFYIYHVQELVFSVLLKIYIYI